MLHSVLDLLLLFDVLYYLMIPLFICGNNLPYNVFFISPTFAAVLLNLKRSRRMGMWLSIAIFLSFIPPSSSIGWGSRIPQLHLCWVVRPSTIKCSGYYTKPSDGDASILELWGMWSTSSLPLLQSPPWPRVEVLVRVSFMSQTEVFDHLTMYKQMNSGLFNVLPINYWFTIIYIYL